VLRGVRDVAAAPAAPVTTAIRGRRVQRAYLGIAPGTAHMQKIVDLLEKAGGRASGFAHAPDYKFSAANSYWTAYKRGALHGELTATLANIKGRPIRGGLEEIFKAIGRSMKTVSQPLFEKYIPQLKNGAFHDSMSAWLEMNPAATQAQQVAEARKIWDSIDNRFGEMVQDNIFWNKLLKQSAQLGMRSYSWNMGTVREIGGGVVDVAKGGDMTARTSYVIALPIWVGTMNAVYQYMKTGKHPESVQDLLAGQTGGTAQGPAIPSMQFPPRKAMHHNVPERVMVPGYQKDVFGWYEDWQQEAWNKMATAPRTAIEIARNQDWKGDPIINPEDAAPNWLKQYFDYVTKNMGPISVRQALQGEKKGSAITPLEQAGGLRPAPPYLQDPDGYKQAQHNRHIIAQKRKAALEKNYQRQFGGSQE
jgi:hypothetical protein